MSRKEGAEEESAEGNHSHADRFASLSFREHYEALKAELVRSVAHNDPKELALLLIKSW